MAAKGYCTTDDVARFLGRTGLLTADQLTQLGNTIEAAEQWIDSELGFGWLGAPVVDRYVVSNGSTVYLGPIDSVQLLQYYGYAADVPYTVVDPNTGQVRLGYSVENGTGMLVSYTPSQTVPALIRQACTVLSAHWMMPTLDPDRFGAKAYTFSGDFQVQIADSDTIPNEVKGYLRAFGRDVVIA